MRGVWVSIGFFDPSILPDWEGIFDLRRTLDGTAAHMALATSASGGGCVPGHWEGDLLTGAKIKDAIDFFHALENGELPAVSYVKPDSLIDGHPASSKLDLFEARTSWTSSRPTPICSAKRHLSSPSMRAAATGTPASSSRSTSSATVHAFRCSWYRRTRAAAGWCTATTTMRHC